MELQAELLTLELPKGPPPASSPWSLGHVLEPWASGIKLSMHNLQCSSTFLLFYFSFLDSEQYSNLNSSKLLTITNGHKYSMRIGI